MANDALQLHRVIYTTDVAIHMPHLRLAMVLWHKNLEWKPDLTLDRLLETFSEVQEIIMLSFPDEENGSPLAKNKPGSAEGMYGAIKEMRNFLAAFLHTRRVRTMEMMDLRG
jgi:hypothetical protein